MKPLKEGDPVEFEHIGRDLKGTILEIMADGKVRVKDERGYLYRYLPENVRLAGTPKPAPAPILPVDSSNSNTNNQTTDTMAKKKSAEKAPAAKNGNGDSNPALSDQKKAIAALTCKKHQRIYLYHALGLDKGEVMQLAGCNAGEISNVRKDYAVKPEKVEAAKALLG